MTGVYDPSVPPPGVVELLIMLVLMLGGCIYFFQQGRNLWNRFFEVKHLRAENAEYKEDNEMLHAVTQAQDTLNKIP